MLGIASKLNLREVGKEDVPILRKRLSVWMTEFCFITMTVCSLTLQLNEKLILVVTEEGAEFR